MLAFATREQLLILIKKGGDWVKSIHSALLGFLLKTHE